MRSFPRKRIKLPSIIPNLSADRQRRTVKGTNFSDQNGLHDILGMGMGVEREGDEQRSMNVSGKEFAKG
jgi:hypothetical protein